MKMSSANLQGVLLFAPAIHVDQRGLFFESYRRDSYLTAGVNVEFVQDNFSHSVKHTLRGLHFQQERPQAKLVSVIYGQIFDVAVDVRCESPTFGQWTGVRLDSEKRQQLYIPTGFAHGFLVLSEFAGVLYKCSNLYYPPAERTLRWNDPVVNIDWPFSGEPILSEKDSNGLALSQLHCSP